MYNTQKIGQRYPRFLQRGANSSRFLGLFWWMGVGAPHHATLAADSPENVTSWLVVWNINVIFRYIGNSHPN